MCYEDLSSLKKRNLRGEVIGLYSSLKREIGKGDIELFSLGSRHRTYRSGSNYIRQGLDWILGSFFFTERIVKY